MALMTTSSPVFSRARCTLATEAEASAAGFDGFQSGQRIQERRKRVTGSKNPPGASVALRGRAGPDARIFPGPEINPQRVNLAELHRKQAEVLNPVEVRQLPAAP